MLNRRTRQAFNALLHRSKARPLLPVIPNLGTIHMPPARPVPYLLRDMGGRELLREASIQERNERNLTQFRARLAQTTTDTTKESTMMTKTITKDDEPLICEWLNCETAEVDADGDVWVAEQMSGHWLSAEKKAAYLDWRAATYPDAG